MFVSEIIRKTSDVGKEISGENSQGSEEDILKKYPQLFILQIQGQQLFSRDIAIML